MAKKKNNPKKTLPSPEAIAMDLIDGTHLLSHPECPFSFHLAPGAGRVLVLAGENATGKSLLASMVASRAYHDHGVEPMVVSMNARTSSSMLRALTYGGEDYRATGEVSLSVSLKAICAIKDRLGDDNKGRALAILDEPDVGLAEGFSHAFGCKLGQMINDLPGNDRWGVLVITHSRQMVRGLADTLKTKPGFMHCGQPMGLDQWCAQQPRHTVDELDGMLDRAGSQIRQVRSILDELDKPPGRSARGAKAKP